MTFISDPPNLILVGLSTCNELSPGYVQVVECNVNKFEVDVNTETYNRFTSRYLYDPLSGK